MACLLVPAAEAVVVSVVGKTINESNKKNRLNPLFRVVFLLFLFYR